MAQTLFVCTHIIEAQLSALVEIMATLILPSRAEVTRLERLAEEAYAAMHDGSLQNAKNSRDDAQRYLGQALELATRKGMTRTAARLRQRRRHISSAYMQQSR